MSASIRRIRALLTTQAAEFRRDFGSVFFSFAFPLFFVAVLVLGDLMDPAARFEFGLVDPHRNPAAQQIASALTESDVVQVRSLAVEDAHAELRSGEVHAVLVFPPEEVAPDGAELEVLVVPAFRDVALVMLDAVRARIAETSADLDVFDVAVQTIDVPSRSQFAFLFPGMLALALLQLGLFGTATPLLRARERGTLRHLALTPLPLRELLCAQLAIRFAISFAQVALLLSAGMFVLDLAVADWLAVLGVAVVGTMMLVAIGYALAGVAPNIEAGMTLIMLTNFTMMFAGNVFWDPNDAAALFYIAHLLPVSYLSDLFRQVISDNRGLWPIWVDLLAMLAWTAAAVTLASRTFRFDMSARHPRHMRTRAA